MTPVVRRQVCSCDGYIELPDTQLPSMRVVAGIIGGNRQGVPEWMRTIYVDMDDIQIS